MNETLRLECVGTVVSRPPKGDFALGAILLVVAAVCAGSSASIPGPHRAEAATALLVVSALIGVAGSATCVWVWRATVVADEVGLRWREIGRWHIVSWDGVADYYDRSTRRHQRGTISVVETSVGKFAIGPDWQHGSELRDAIRRGALSARTREWGVKGLRPEDRWPQAFAYQRVVLQRVAMQCAIVAVIAYGTYFTAEKAPRTIDDLGWAMGLAAVGTLVAVFGVFPLMYAAMLRKIGSSKGRTDQRITVTPEEIVYEDARGAFGAPWTDVTAYYIDEPGASVSSARRYVVETRAGSLDFVSVIRGSQQLVGIIEHFARSAAASEWKVRDADAVEALSGAPRPAATDQKVYHYRTRTVRALLWMPGSIAAAALPMAWLTSHGYTGQADTVAPTVIGTLLTLATMWAYWRSRAAAVFTDDASITQLGVFGRTNIPWSEVSAYRVVGGDAFTFATVSGGGRRVWFWLGIFRYSELKAEISRRAVNAKRRGW